MLVRAMTIWSHWPTIMVRGGVSDYPLCYTRNYSIATLYQTILTLVIFVKVRRGLHYINALTGIIIYSICLAHEAFCHSAISGPCCMYALLYRHRWGDHGSKTGLPKNGLGKE